MSSNPNVPLAPLANPAAVTIAQALDDATGTIPANIATVGITAECTTGDLSDFDDWFEVQWQDLTQPSPVWVRLAGPVQMSATPIPIPAKFDVLIAAPPGGFRHGFYQLRSLQFRDFGGLPGGAGDTSDPGAFTVDLVPPYADLTFREQPDAPVFPLNLPAGTPITDGYLITNGGVMFGIPDNTFVQPPGQWAAGDVITFYWSVVMFPRPGDIVSPPGGIPMLQTGNTFFLPSAMIDISGLFHAFYTLRDRSGNISRPSFIEGREVRLIADPERLSPFLPLAPAPEGGSTDGLLNIADYKQGIDVWVRAYNNHAPLLDRLEVQWGTQPYGPQGVPFTTFPQIFTGMNPAIVASYTQMIGPQPIPVRYRISRNGMPFTSFDKVIQLDLSVGGPVNPGEPGTPNINLNIPHVFGDGSTIADVLLPEHADLPVRVDILLWTVAELPHPGLSIIFLWEDERVGPFPIGTAAPGATFSFTIDWDVVARHGNDLKTIKYLVIDPAQTSNENESPENTVDVRDAVTVMLPPAQYVDRNSGDRWNCASLKTRTPGTPPVLYGEVYVPGDSRMQVGMPLTLTLSLTNTLAGRPPGPFVLILTHPRLSEIDIDRGVTFEIDYMPYLAQAPTGNCRATYSTVLQNGSTGNGAQSDTRVGMSNPHTYCDGTIPTAP